MELGPRFICMWMERFVFFFISACVCVGISGVKIVGPWGLSFPMGLCVMKNCFMVPLSISLFLNVRCLLFQQALISGNL